ncbi:HWE histidine kinase domain-containing protein [Qipengyuania nanhaisediminis]|uniref:histidine kinase n=1 Tax=Qipengyuania nanhaisediminis TaxID=604088 RepID=A0A1I5KCF6_9SPHN|nr:HWE histidine kinase domain-containing protein [Qipengyuania nanhaisediminis]SFO82709.1 Bacteriophytochrome (light-regulated signal transduction histidine kinase) [Qipengyuania nanhaisediminis]
MSAPDYQVDLTNCDREPIHQLGRIQSFGALVAVNTDWLVSQRSTNLEKMLGLDEEIEIGSRLSNVLAGPAVDQLRSAVSGLIDDDQIERLFGLDLRGDGTLFDCALHCSGPYSIIEIERHKQGDISRQLGLLRPAMQRLEKLTDLDTLLEEAARQVRTTLHMDRVMIYRFHGDLSGEVVAESARGDLEKFHGLRYPKSDIPAQARELYVRNRFRIISDVNDEPVAIEPGITAEGAPLDLSMSTLRAVSPIHIEYLRNMGVEASLSISIVIGGKLWGLFACHHYSPKFLPYSQRTAAELYSEIVSLLIERALNKKHSKLRDRGREVHDRLMRDIVAGQSLLQSLPTLDPVIGQIIPHDGISIFVDDIYKLNGKGPNEEEFRALVKSLNAAATSRVLAVDELPARFPRAERFSDRAVGALIIPVSRSPRDYLVLWRSSLDQVVTWAGNPDKPVEMGPNGARLTPRKSFEAWQETVEGKSSPWTDGELQMADQLRVSLLEIILRLTDKDLEERRKAQAHQELLIAELNHRVRNILNLIRGLINQSRGDARDIETFTEIVGGRVSALALAHDNITKGNWSSAPLGELIDSEAKAYLAGKTDRLRVTGPEAQVNPEAYTVLALVIHEMFTNSAKYGSLSDSTGLLEITTRRDYDDSLVIDWTESQGPPVRPPSRRGFGSTIIERSIPHELGGEARVDYKLSGVEASFRVPDRFVEWDEAEQAATSPADSEADGVPNSETDSDTKPAPGSVLLVEDSMIIALDAEDCLKELGVAQVRVESSVAGAMEALAKNDFEAAILDYNLGGENSEAIAKELAGRGTPFWMATGYGEMKDRVEELGARGLLTKPYGKKELEQLLSDLSAS